MQVGQVTMVNAEIRPKMRLEQSAVNREVVLKTGRQRPEDMDSRARWKVVGSSHKNQMAGRG